MNKILFSILLLFSLLFSLLNLGTWPLMDFDEAIYAKVYHESSTRNNFFTFTYLNEPWFEKPPLYFWLSKGSAAIFGENEFSLRFPSALLITISILLVFLIVHKMTKDWTAAFLSALVLSTTAYFLFSGRQLRFDIPVTSTILLSFYAFLKTRDKSVWFLIFCLSVASGVMFKSVIGILVYLIILLYSLVYKDFRWLKDKWFWLSNVLALVFIFPWHFYQNSLFGVKFWNSYILNHVLKRTTETVVFGDKNPFLYHFQQLFVVTQPWFLVFIILSMIFLVRSKLNLKKYQFEFFTLLSALLIFFLFYIPQTRLLYYFIPMLPFMAMFIGTFTARLLKKHRQIVIIMFSLFVGLGIIHASLKIFSDKDRGFFLQALPRISRYMVANEEKLVAEIAAKEKNPLYLYNWQFFPTLIYYSEINGGVNLEKIIKGSSLNPPFLVLLPTPIFKGSLPAILPKHATGKILYKGKAATLIKVFSNTF